MIKPVSDFILEKTIAENPDSFEIFEGDNFRGLYNLITNEIIQWNPATNKISGEKYKSLFDALCSELETSLEYKGLTGEKRSFKEEDTG